jgi:hypothetical protein
MLQYVFNTDLEDDEPMMFSAEDQCWDDDTLKQLREEYDIIFMTSGEGVMPVMILNKDGQYPLFVLGSEDDGTIFFDREYGHFRNTFSPYWVKYLIADLEEALRVCNKTT